jgi:heptosyltransferase III
MFGRLSKNSPVKHILVVSLSNIGDVVLTCPVLDILLYDFPGAEVTLIVGPKAASLFAGHPRIRTIIYDKHSAWAAQALFFWGLLPGRYDVIVDLRNTALGFLLSSRWRTPLVARSFEGHMRTKHLRRLQAIYPDHSSPRVPAAIVPRAPTLSKDLGSYVVIAPGAADSAKRWTIEGFSAVADLLVQQGHAVVFVGSRDDVAIVDGIRQLMSRPSTALAGQLDLCELAYVLRQARFAITHDSGPMHLASYFNVPVIVLWGPTDRGKYAPWSAQSAVIFRGKQMSSISVKDVADAIAQMP